MAQTMATDDIDLPVDQNQTDGSEIRLALIGRIWQG